MADIQAHLSARLGEVKDAVKENTQTLIEQYREMQRYRGEKFIRLPLVQGKAAGGVLALGGDAQGDGTMAMPNQGWLWSVRHLVIEGLTAGASPDVVNIFRGSALGRLVWQLNGNQFAQTWGRGEIVLQPGETLFYGNVGTFAATGTITIHGSAMEVPAEQAGKFF